MEERVLRMIHVYSAALFIIVLWANTVLRCKMFLTVLLLFCINHLLKTD